jgi:PD-(D/E)XK nuclease superfamily
MGELTEKVIGIFYDVYNELGYGFLDLVIALREAGYEVKRQLAIPLWFESTKSDDSEGMS